MSSDPVGFWARRRSVKGPPARRQEKRTAARRLSFRAARCIELDSEGPPLRNRVRKRRWFGQPDAHKIVARPTVGDSRGWSDSASCLATSISSQHTRLGMRRTGGRARFMPAWGLVESPRVDIIMQNSRSKQKRASRSSPFCADRCRWVLQVLAAQADLTKSASNAAGTCLKQA